jgi:hypothetical protein
VEFTFTNTVGTQIVCYIESPLTDIAASGVAGAYTIVSQNTASAVITNRLEFWTANAQFHAQCNSATNNQLYACSFSWTDPRGRLE